VNAPLDGPRRRGWRAVLIGFALIALLGLGISAAMFSSWSRLEAASPEDAAAAFAAARVEAGGGEPYLAISDSGDVRVRRELERQEPVELEALHLLAWDPGRSRMLRVRFPFWFVEVKMNEALNLGTLVSALAGDWEHLDLRVAEEDLRRRGPGIVLDHALPSAARILIWTE